MSDGEEVLSNLAPELRWEIGEATTWSPDPFIFKDADGNEIDLTGYTARLKIRAGHDSTSVLLDASAYVTLGGAAGTIAVNIPDNVMAAQTWRQGIYLLEIESALGATLQLLRGTVERVAGRT